MYYAIHCETHSSKRATGSALQEAMPDIRFAEAYCAAGEIMTITISNLTVAQNAPAGTIVGVLTASDTGVIIPCNFILSKKSSGFFAISSNDLITAWSGSIAPGYYSVRVHAVGISKRFSGSATFIVTVTDAPPPPPPPPPPPAPPPAPPPPPPPPPAPPPAPPPPP